MSASVDSASVEPIIGEHKPGKKVIICTPCLVRPHEAYQAALRYEVPLLQAAGWDEGAVWKIGCPYISAARAILLRQALDAKADVIVFLDYDVSWQPGDLLRLIETEGDVVAGTYRFKREPEEYMGSLLPGLDGKPQVRDDGALKGFSAPAGFLKVTRRAVNRFLAAYPNLAFGEKCNPHVDLFNHGAHGGMWFGEDYAFCRNWIDAGGELWIVPDLDIAHHDREREYAGNFHRWLLRQPGGSEWQQTSEA